MRLRLGLASGFVGLAAASGAWAQAQDIDVASLAAQDSKAPARHDIKAIALVTYDTNVARSDEATAKQRGVVREEFIYDPTLSVDFLQPFGQQALFLQGSWGYEHHDQNGILDAARISALAGATRKIARCNLALTVGYNSQQTDLADLLLNNTVKNIQETKQAGVGGGCGGGIGLAETFSVSYQRTDNSQGILESSDNRSTTATVGLGYANKTLGQASVFASYTRAQFPNAAAFAILSPVAPTTGYKSWSGGVKLEHHVGVKIDGDVTIGYTNLTTEGGSLPGFQGMTYQGNLTYNLSHRIRFVASFSNKAQPSNLPGASYNIQRQYQIAGHYALNTRAGFDLGFSETKSRYDDFLNAAGPATRINDDTKAEFATMTYNIGRRISTRLDVRHEDRNVLLPGLSVPDNRVSLTLTGSY